LGINSYNVRSKQLHFPAVLAGCNYRWYAGPHLGISILKQLRHDKVILNSHIPAAGGTSTSDVSLEMIDNGLLLVLI
jgi:hypothetical protein